MKKKEKSEVESPENKKKRLELQKRYDDECRKLNAARNFPDTTKSVEAIRLCGDNIIAIKAEAKEAQIIINLMSDESFGTDEPHVHITKEGQAVFVCGNVRFNVDIKDLNKVVGANGESNPLDKLLDSQIMELARSAGLQIEPFVRSLLDEPLKGLLQIAWYRDVEKHESDNLKTNQQGRIERYHRNLSKWREGDSSESTNGTSTPRKTRTAAKIMIPADQHKKLLELHKKGQSTGAIALALGMERSKSSRAAIRSTLRSLAGQSK